MISAPKTWLSVSLRLTIRPQSCTATILFTRTMPVSMSTETSAICTPPTPLLIRSPGPGLAPRTVIGTPPILPGRFLPGQALARVALHPDAAAHRLERGRLDAQARRDLREELVEQVEARRGTSRS